MGKIYEAVSKDNQEALLDLEESCQNLPADDHSACFAVPGVPVGVAVTKGANVEKLSLKRDAIPSMNNKEHFALDDFSQPRNSLMRSPRIAPIIPERLDPHLIMWQELPSPEAEREYRRLAVSLITANAQRSFKRVLFSSAQHGEGRTTVMLNVAGALARARLRVLVVDTDFVRPSVLRLLGVESAVGLAEIFTNAGHAGEAVVTLHPLGITVLGTREAVETPAEILASAEFRELLNFIEEDYDFILFDSPPLLDSADANLLTRMVDTTLMVIRPDTTSTAQMRRAVSLMKREDISGVVLNRVAQK